MQHDAKNREAIIRKIKDMLVQVSPAKGVTAADIGDDDYIINKKGPLALDSLDALEVAVSLEKHFGVSFSGVATARNALRSVNALADFLLAGGIVSDVASTEIVETNPTIAHP